MKKPENPFLLHKYWGPGYFCDREEESQYLKAALVNGRHIMVHSPRRYGKTGLIHHVFNQTGRKRGVKHLYFDIYSIDSVQEFNQVLLNEAMRVLSPSPKQILKKTMDWFGSLRPSVSFDMSGAPKISIASVAEKTAATHTREIFRVINERCKTLYLAIDEFQQIDNFKGVRMDAVLRTCMQASPNIRFIFSGSKRHMLLDMFNNAGRSFYSSVDQLELKRIERKLYVEFAIRHFKAHKRVLSEENANRVLEWCNGHTYYVQVFFNRMFSRSGRMDRAFIDQIAREIVLEQDAIMSTLRAALAKTQWQLLKAVSIEGQVIRPTGSDFIRKHELNSSAATIKALQALVDKELVYVSGFEKENGKPVYEAYNPFMRNWFRQR